MINWIGIFFSILFLAYPLCSLPSIVKSKQEKGVFFSDPRFFISKAEGNGMGINTKNRFGFFVLLLIGLIILFFSFVYPS
ncbi:hypothetical protein [Enterococcus sp. LJL99]